MPKDGTWPNGQGGVLACRRSYVRAPSGSSESSFRSNFLLTASGSST
jgi:hypothetical protein